MNSTGKRIIQKTLAILVILVMTMADFSLVGANLVSYAIDQIEVNNSNVGFNVYFLDGNKSLETTATTDSNDLKLAIELSVKKDGYLSNGKIELEEGANFRFTKTTNNSYISKIEDRYIELNQINEGDSVKIEVGIKLAESAEFNSEYLSKASTINLSGKYINSKNVEKNESTDIAGKAQARVIWKSPANVKSELKAELLTNTTYKKDEEKKHIVQLLVKSKIANNSYPVKSTNIEVELTNLLTSVKVHKRTTKATNGDRDINYEYKDGKLTINALNGADNKISWTKNAEDVFVVTMEYPENAEKELIETLSKIPVVSTIMTYDDKELVQNAEIDTTSEKEGFVSTVISEKEKTIGKGKIYAGEQRNYISTTNLYVDYADAVQSVELNEQNAVFIADDEDQESSIEFLQTTIDREQFIQLFGEEGTMQVEDPEGVILATINKDSKTNNNGNIIINYDEGIKNVKFTTSKPLKEGTLSLEHQKCINKTDYSRKEIKNITKIKDSNKISYKIDEENTKKTNSEATIEIKETESKATLSVDPVTLSTSQNGQELNIKVVLETNNENRDLFKNPEIKLQLPSQINSIDAQAELLYGNGLKIDTFKVNAKDSTITANLKGEQKSYEGDAVKGATLLIKANVKLDKLATNSSEKITLNYTNDNATKYVDNQQEKVNVNVVSENSIIITNDISGYNVTTIGNEGNKEVKLQNSSEAKKATVNMQFVNNEEADISNIGILGKIANEPGKIDRTSAIKVDTEATIYYTNSENPTTQISKKENGWTTENIKDAKFYLIIIKNVKNGEKVKFNYNIQVAKDLPYNIVAETGFKMFYTNSLTGTEKNAQSSILVLSTGTVAVLNTEISAEVSGKAIKDGDEVKAGEIIKYTAKVSNTGRENAKDATFTATIPEGTTLIKLNPQYEENIGQVSEETENQEIQESTQQYFINSTDNKITKSNIEVEAGKSVTYSYMVKVNKDLAETKETSTKVSISLNNNTIDKEFKQKLVKAEIALTLKPAQRKIDTTLNAGNRYLYILDVENISDKEQKNVEVTINKNDLLELTEIEYTSGDIYEKIDKDLTFTIKSIPAKSTAYVQITMTAKQANNKANKADIFATVKDSDQNNYKSNIVSEKVQGVLLDVSLSAKKSQEVEDEYIHPGDEIKYTIKVKNVGDLDAEELAIEDKISDYLGIEKVTLNGKDYDYTIEEVYGENDNFNYIRIESPLKAGEEATVEITAKVDEDISTEEILKVINQVYIYNNVLLFESTENIAYLESIPEVLTKNGEEDLSDGNVEEQDNNNQSNQGQQASDNAPKYIISGTIWEDVDQNGSRDSGEALLEGIKVYAIDVTNNEIAKDSNGNQITSTTKEDGLYTLTNLPKGRYIVAFEYNTDKYMTTVYQAKSVSTDKNSDAVKATRTINGEEKTLAVTDSIELTANKANIDLGLAETKVFDLQLEKVISKMVVTNSSGTKTYNFDDASLAKVEIAGKNLSDSNVVIEYKIKVTNKGEIAGYAKTIVDYIPSSLTFNSGLNSDWYQKGENIYTSSLANTKIEPGETKEVKLVLTKKMTESNTGLTNNKAEIINSYNTLGVTNASENASKQNNNKESKAKGSADTIIGVKTGAAVSYVALTLTVVIVIAAAAYLVNKKLLIEKIEI